MAERIFIAVAMTALSRADLVAWVMRYRQTIDGLKDGATVLAHARARFKALPEEMPEEVE
jgi:hypothetical protein